MQAQPKEARPLDEDTYLEYIHRQVPPVSLTLWFIHLSLILLFVIPIIISWVKTPFIYAAILLCIHPVVLLTWSPILLLTSSLTESISTPSFCLVPFTLPMSSSYCLWEIGLQCSTTIILQESRLLVEHAEHKWIHGNGLSRRVKGRRINAMPKDATQGNLHSMTDSLIDKVLPLSPGQFKKKRPLPTMNALQDSHSLYPGCGWDFPSPTSQSGPKTEILNWTVAIFGNEIPMEINTLNSV